MSTSELVQFLSDSAKETIDRAESAKVHLAAGLLDEAEELLAVSFKVACRAKTNTDDIRKAA